MRIVLTITAVFVLLLGGARLLQGQTTSQPEIAQIVARSQQALNQSDDKMALSVVTDGLRRFPGNADLQVQLAAVYAYEKRDPQALTLLKEVLRNNPSSRPAKLKLAQIHGYRGEYAESDRLYRELLSASPDDETAALGLVHNLILEGKREEAQRQAQQALQRHPTSLLLQQYIDSLSKSAGREVHSERFGRVQASESFFADSSGNHAVDSFQGISYQFAPEVSSHVRLYETSLWRATTPAVRVLSADDEVRFRVNKYLALRGSGGGVRYADTSSKWIASGDLDLFAARSLTISGGYSRYAVVPTFDSTLFDLLSEGWHGDLDYHTKNFTLTGNSSLTHYSDGNRAEREWGEALRWCSLGKSLSIGAGYAFRHLHFAQEVNHGYFSPSQYWSHLAGGGFRVRIGRHYHGELLAYGGVETQDAGPYTPAGEATLRNGFNFGRWDFAADYSYYHLAQATGAFHANAGTVSLAYKF